jgi:hypothetical protein
VEELFSNITWVDTSPNLPPEHHHIVENWTTRHTSIFTNLGSISQNYNSAENFSDKFSSSNF